MDKREKAIYKVTLTGTAVNAVLIALKFAAGIAGRSSAMVADAVHSLSDFITDVVVLVFVKIAGKPRDKGHDYGHGKFETLATMIIGTILILAGIALMVNGIELVAANVRGQISEKPSAIALFVAIISIATKELLFRYTRKVGTEENSPAVTANAWHHRSDAMSSVGTLAGISGAMFLGDKWRILDPIAAIIVSLFIVKSGYDILKPAVGELLESALPEELENDILELVLSVRGIEKIHNMRTRRIGNAIAISLHAGMDGNLSLHQAHAIATAAENAIKNKYGANTFVNIHMEPLTEK